MGEDLREKGNKAFASGKFAEAIEWYTKAIDSNSPNMHCIFYFILFFRFFLFNCNFNFLLIVYIIVFILFYLVLYGNRSASLCALGK